MYRLTTRTTAVTPGDPGEALQARRIEVSSEQHQEAIGASS
jgi:hypothetical protein